MPEVSNMPLPKKLLAQGVRDMVRICDGRMSGTANNGSTMSSPAGAPNAWATGSTSSRRHR
jgi:dihydroxyacid dehydratase/phosphogluconate dehydratase